MPRMLPAQKFISSKEEAVIGVAGVKVVFDELRPEQLVKSPRTVLKTVQGTSESQHMASGNVHSGGWNNVDEHVFRELRLHERVLDIDEFKW